MKIFRSISNGFPPILVIVLLYSVLANVALAQLCNVNITSITHDPTTSPLNVSVTGTVNPLAPSARCDTIKVTLICPDGSQSSYTTVQGGSNWTTEFVPSDCECDDQYTVTAECIDAHCTPDTDVGTFVCDSVECPSILDIDVNINDCELDPLDGVAKRKVEFVPTFTGTPNFYRWDFGDGTPFSTTLITGPPALVSGSPFLHFYETAPPTQPTLELIGPEMCLANWPVPLAEFEEFEICGECPVINEIIIEQIPETCEDVENAGGKWFVTVNADISNKENVAGDYVWNFGDGEGNVCVSSDATNAPAPDDPYEYKCPNSGDYHITLTVDCRIDATYHHDLTKTITLPTCDCPITDEDEITAVIGKCNVKFNATISGSCASAVTEYIWDFGHGDPQTTDSPNNVPHTYGANGPYTVILTLGGVSDDGSTCFLKKEIEITRCIGGPPDGDDDKEDEEGGGISMCGIFDWCCWLLALFVILYILFWVLWHYNVLPAAWYVGIGALAAFLVWIIICQPTFCAVLLALFAAGIVALAAIGVVALIPGGPNPVAVISAVAGSYPAMLLSVLTLILIPITMWVTGCLADCNSALTCFQVLWNNAVTDCPMCGP